MQKKLGIITVIMALLLTIAIPALASTDKSNLDSYKKRIEMKKSYVDQAVKNGQLTEEQSKTWKNHFDYMIKFHEQNGFIFPKSRFGKDGGPNSKSVKRQGFGPDGQKQNSQ